MAGSYRSLPTSNLLGSVPAAVDTYHKASQFEEEKIYRYFHPVMLKIERGVINLPLMVMIHMLNLVQKMKVLNSQKVDGKDFLALQLTGLIST